MKTKVEQMFTVTNEFGLHLRPAGTLAATVQRFAAEVRILYNGQTVDARSPLGILLLGANLGAVVTVVAHGEDADRAMASVGSLFSDGFANE